MHCVIIFVFVVLLLYYQPTLFILTCYSLIYNIHVRFFIVISLTEFVNPHYIIPELWHALHHNNHMNESKVTSIACVWFSICNYAIS